MTLDKFERLWQLDPLLCFHKTEFGQEIGGNSGPNTVLRSDPSVTQISLLEHLVSFRLQLTFPLIVVFPGYESESFQSRETILWNTDL